MSELRVVLITARTNEAEELAAKIVEARMAACVNIVPSMTSIYWLNNKVQRAEESLLVAKSTTDRVQALIDFVEDEHSYALPEIIAMPVSEGLSGYFDWVRKEASGDPSSLSME